MDKIKACILDIDDTLVDFLNHLITIHNNLYKTNIKRRDITEYKLPPELLETFKKYENWIYVSCPILPKTIQRIEEFKKDGYAIVLMTARDESFFKQTEFNLALNGIHYDDLYFNKNKSLKINRLQEKYDIQIFADDRSDTVNKVKRDTLVPYVYLINVPSNRDDSTESGVIRINNINEIR